jgi:hypothetical protein
MWAYPALTFLSCFIELGAMLVLLKEGRGLEQVLAALLAFQIANLHSILRPLGPRTWPLASAAGAVLLTLRPLGLIGFAAGIYAAKLAIQSLRNDLKVRLQISHTAKALPRLLGFAVAPLFSSIIGASLVAILAAAAILGLRPFAQSRRAALEPLASDY